MGALAVKDQQAYGIGIDLGGTNVKVVAVTRAGQVLQRERFGTADETAGRWMEGVRACVAKLEGALGQADSIGVASPGLAARDGRSIAWMMGRLESVMGVDWTQLLQRQKVVPVLNDAHAALLGEVWQGAARGAHDAVMLTLGTGVGGAILCDGHLLKGHLGRAGHLGHLSLNPDGEKDIVNTPGSLEDAIGECTLAQRGQGRFASTKQLVEAYRAGDAAAGDIWLASVKALAAGMASIANAVDPEVFILGGGIAAAGEALMAPLSDYLDQFEWRPTGTRVRLVPAVLEDESGALGAAWNGMKDPNEPG
jgi:glucokinase